MKILHFSDTHGTHKHFLESIRKTVKSEDIDVLVHSGDFMRDSMKYQDFSEFLDFLNAIDVKHKVVVAGNHDVWCEYLEADKDLRNQIIPGNVYFLINESVIIDGVKFWGSPYTPWFYDWAFQLHEHEAEALWPTIPDDTDVLVTHGPAYGVLDDAIHEGKVVNAGCKYLKKRIDELNIKAHLFGHIHEGYGAKDVGYTALNSSLLDRSYKLTNEPQIIEIE